MDHEAKQVVCYDELGCFDKLPPFSPSMPLPMSPSKIQTEYYLRTRHNLLEDQPIIPDAANLTASHFDPAKRTKVIIHGFVVSSFFFGRLREEEKHSIFIHSQTSVFEHNPFQKAIRKAICSKTETIFSIRINVINFNPFQV